MRVLSVWIASATMSHIRRMCSRMSSGRPLSGPLHRHERLALVLRPVGGLAQVAAHPLGALLHVPHARQVLVQLGAVVLADAAAQAGRFPADAVQDALHAPAAAVLEQAVERQRGIDLAGNGRIRALPGDVRAIGHREVRLVVAGQRLLAGQHQTRLDRVLPDARGQHLIHADAAVQHGALA